MIRMNSIFYLLSALSICNYALADEIDKNTAQMQAMDKITGRVSMINVPVGGEVKFGSLSIIARSCKTRPVEETPDNFVFADIADTTLQGEQINIFKGWMISSSPATHAVEHPIYDVWLLKCHDTKVEKKQLLSEDQLAERDNLPMVRNGKIVSDSTVAESETIPQSQIVEMQSEDKSDDNAAQEMMSSEFVFDEGDEETSDEAQTNEDTTDIQESDDDKNNNL